jgi:hypothetical protein
MNFTHIRQLFSRNDHFKDSAQVIEYAFSCGGTDYYQHADEMNMPYRRALKALTFYKELDMKCDRLYLESHIRAMDELFAGKKIGFDEMAKMKRLNEQLKERVQWIVVDDHVYKIASVRFFDRAENPNDYDYKYNEKKIAHWKKSEPVKDFFLREPIGRLVPFLRSVPVDLESYSMVVNDLTRAHLDYMWAILSPQQKTALQNSIGISSLAEILPARP